MYMLISFPQFPKNFIGEIVYQQVHLPDAGRQKLHPALQMSAAGIQILTHHLLPTKAFTPRKPESTVHPGLKARPSVWDTGIQHCLTATPNNYPWCLQCVCVCKTMNTELGTGLKGVLQSKRCWNPSSTREKSTPALSRRAEHDLGSVPAIWEVATLISDVRAGVGLTQARLGSLRALSTSFGFMIHSAPQCYLGNAPVLLAWTQKQKHNPKPSDIWCQFQKISSWIHSQKSFA